MTDRAALLDYAEDALDGTVSLGSRAPRTAAVLARCALEDWLNEQSADWCGPPDRGGPTTASKLVVLGTLHGSDVGEQVKRLWHGLSRACHHHAYELQPSAGEIQALIAQVRALTEMQDRST
ncbi:hypothetical protein [Mycolicibacterium thermoresistibile]|jgi:hypothetical protein|uniref:Uncharacterized protein n=2 Tax=Mycolicibacterium thermoresistibile TaxID=1797 RepID=G7CBJ0_MYCT3|nr:hypothetical protein [Mycolicibacterium thermoresistibile]EHI14665.1 hypothetical protein KEK_01790 [Mycolicibacterium thermoresistibile ATCC 19527]MCV7188129.1 hypothetical protein [Mycolicibacterium thermoresistibile]GAT13199.1 putative uncharacterized protein [Mycolicibacterium thermoresistibile]SNW18626.1 Uncharacterised protein [Mycolicibacterium thermoresistibile]